MLTQGIAQFIGRRSGQGQRGPWYQISIVSEGEPVSLRCSPNVYDECGNLEFGDEISFNLNSRLYDHQWVLSISSLNG